MTDLLTLRHRAAHPAMTNRPIATEDTNRLAEAFEVLPGDIVVDAQKLLGCTSPWDELLASLCQVHNWSAEMGVIYMAHLIAQVDPTAGPLPAAWSAT
jgi:hypothetical protein